MAAMEDDTMELHPEKRSKPNLPPPQIRHLPPEIITVILSRLPVKSLLQFRSVSKSWRSLISDPKFVKTHLKICSKNDEIAHHRLIFISNRHRMLSCHLSPVFNGISVDPTELDYPMKHQPDVSIWIVGSINGLICISMNEHAFFWNPTTRISKKLPRSGTTRRRGCLIVYGFGYDESTDDYRLVGVFGGNGIVMVYSLRTGCWRKIGNFPSGQASGESGKFVNGAIHWIAHVTQNANSNLPFSKSVVSFDLAKETFGEVAQPSYGEGKFDLALGVLGERLCVQCDYPGSQIDVWMMKEYGVRESWTKLARLPSVSELNIFVFPVLLHISKKGEILMGMGSRIVVYDPRTNSLRITDIQNVHAYLEANTYIESLVSPLNH